MAYKKRGYSMEGFVKGNIVVINFPFSNNGLKRRPALVLVNLLGDDLILCQITSTKRINSIELKETDFEKGRLFENSFIRIEKIFTLEKNKVVYKIGTLKKEKIIEIENLLVKLFTKLKKFYFFVHIKRI
ncbi:MAG: type II toxin-antitoxin system PemK/MazF family toxin [Candidatus ainarchaeum sp.]|nr:type II toxin-antitoxin system PemK/MazF family toxin [Candidatus ainarchaeum sp.]